jgi:hypothetical protein
MQRSSAQRLAPGEPQRRAGRLVLTLIALACATWPAARTQAAAEERTEDKRAAAEATPPQLLERQAEAEAVRELKFKKPPAYKQIKRDAIVPFLEKALRDRYGEGELDNLLAAYEKLGLIKSAEGLAQSLVVAYAGQVIAFYDEDTHFVYVIEDLPMPALVQRIAELHELVHALQDQHFDLTSLPLDVPYQTDRTNAAMALAEGDATLATLEYAAKHARATLRDVLRIAFWSFEPDSTTPYLFRREARFVYFDGLSFARVLYADGGWEALNKAYAHPPTSTEQVLHARRKYLEERDEPTPIALPDCADALGAGWKLVAQDTLGELYTQVLFRQHLSFARAGKPSRGWDGDRLHFYRSGDGKGDDSALVWRSVWDTDRDAQEFAAAYRKVLERKLGAAPGAESPDEPGADDTHSFILSGERGAAAVRVEGLDVLIVEAPSVPMARAVVGHILAGAHGPDREAETADEELNSR